MAQKSQYYNRLLDSINNLNQYYSLSGGEGVVYFLDDKFVVKEYKTIEKWDEFDKVFYDYCQQMQQFANSGYSIPKIYAWVKIPNMNYYIKNEKNKFRYFILEERVAGRELFFGFIEDAYDIVKDLCSNDEFKKVLLTNPDSNLFCEIVKRYFEDYIRMNEIIESMPEGELSKFVVDSYKMFLTGKNIYPDLYPHNILIDDSQKICMIDPHFESEARSGDEYIKKSDYLTDMINLFLYNGFVNKPDKMLKHYKDGGFNFSRLENEINQNKKLSKRALIRLLTIINLYCDNPKVLNARSFALVLKSLKMVFDRKDVNEVLSYVGFER